MKLFLALIISTVLSATAYGKKVDSYTSSGLAAYGHGINSYSCGEHYIDVYVFQGAYKNGPGKPVPSNIFQGFMSSYNWCIVDSSSYSFAVSDFGFSGNLKKGAKIEVEVSEATLCANQPNGNWGCSSVSVDIVLKIEVIPTGIGDSGSSFYEYTTPTYRYTSRGKGSFAEATANFTGSTLNGDNLSYEDTGGQLDKATSRSMVFTVNN